MYTQEIQYVEKLSPEQQFRLVEIAHETTDMEIRRAAMRILKNYLGMVTFHVTEK